MGQYDTLHLGLPKRFLQFYLSKVIMSSLHTSFKVVSFFYIYR